MSDIEKLADHLPDYQFIVWGIEGYECVPSERARFNPEGTRFIGLFYHRHHYEYVTHTVKHRPSRFCYKCFKFDDDHHDQRCEARCRRCGYTDCEPGHATIHCGECNIDFRSQKCYDYHLTPVSMRALPFCKKYFFCKVCLTVDRTDAYRKEPHVCGARSYCYVCRKVMGANHKCAYHVPTDEDKRKRLAEQETWKTIVYDMECVVAESGEYSEVARGPRHEPNFIGVHMFCSACFNGAHHCDTCLKPWSYSYKDTPMEERRVVQRDLVDTSEDESDDDEFDLNVIYRSEERKTPLARFAKFLMTDSRANKAYVIAHNGGGYDHPQVLGEMDRQGGAKSEEPKVILNGMKIISAEYTFGKQKLFFRDSFQFLPMALAKMPEAFGLDGEAKGFFPYLWNHPDNYDKVLPTLPPKVYYNPQYYSPSKAEEFEKWYEDHYNDGFNLHDELEKYCMSDVRILTLTLICFIKLCGKLFNGWNPLVHGTTVASYAMFVMKHEYIKPGDLGYVPENGYNSDRNSVLALKYLQWLEKEDPNLRLQYMLRGGEHSINVNGTFYKVDGYNKTTNEIFEIHGCLWHGCPKCQPIRDRVNPMCRKTPQELLEGTMRREDDLKSAGYTLHSIWECEIKELLVKNREMKKFFDLNQYTHRLIPRNGVFGGKTNVLRALVEAKGDIEVNYDDFISMYPYLNAGGTAYPRGNPIVLTDGFPDPKQDLTLRGIVFCDVLPCTDAKMGYLPARFGKEKLMFTLCRSCAQDENTWDECPHRKVSERYITGVWTTDELNKAISRGYKVLKYHEIWYWPEKDWVKGGFFASYIKPLLAVKYESSGWPRENMSDEEKKAYVENIEKNDGVKLDASNIKKNKALRSLSKIFLNSAWGKFAQNPVRNETRLVLKYDANVANFFNDPLYEPTGMKPYGEHKLWISRKPKKDAAFGARHANLPVGIITTSAGRLRLTEAIEKVGIENMIYCDTDSLIYTKKKGEDPLAEMKGEYLGHLVSEIPAGKSIQKFVGMAPKSYGLQIRNDVTGVLEHSVKTKGITMHSENVRRITFDGMEKAMQEFIEAGVTEPLEGVTMNFKRGCNAFDGLWTCISKKQLNPRMDKGHLVEGVSIPFGKLSRHVDLIDDYPFY